MKSQATVSGRFWALSIVAGLASLAVLAWWLGGRLRSGALVDGDSAHQASAHAHHHHDGQDPIDISSAAARSIGLRLERLTWQPFVERIHIPAMVVEKPGQSGLAVTSPVQGVITQIHRFPGEALSPGDLVFTLRVADEALEAAQLSLLDILTRIAVAELERERLNPLAETGAITGRRLLEIEYQLKQLLSERSARLQELELRGLSGEQVQRIIQRRELISEIQIRLNVAAVADPLASISTSSIRLASSESILGQDQRSAEGDRTESIEQPEAEVYSIEELNVYPGRQVRKGEELCHIANHHELFIRGDAFESDVAVVRRAMQEGSEIRGEVGQDESRVRIEGLRITYVDNHVDPVTQTFPFYLAVANRVMSQHRDASGRLFRSWQFKPGQRAHLYVPVRQWSDQFVMPRDALVRAGPESYVFRLVPGSPFEKRMTPEQRLRRLESADVWHFEPVPARVLYQDRQQVVLADDGRLKADDLLVAEQAYQVFLAWKLQLSSGAGGHDHEH